MARASVATHQESHDSDVQVRIRLESESWNFSDSKSGGDLHAIHPYPAKFIPEIPRRVLEHVPIPVGTVVLDPFCGAGTTLVEAQRLGIESVGVDLNPIACLLSRVKTTPLTVDLPAL